MTESDALDRLIADMRRRLDDDSDAGEIREAAAETDIAAVLADPDEGADPGPAESFGRPDVDRLASAYAAKYTSDADTPQTDPEAADDAGAADHTETVPPAAGGTDTADARGRGDRDTTGTSRASVTDRAHRVAHFRDTVRTVAEWRAASEAIGPGVFDVASDAETTEEMSDRLAAQFADADFEVRSYTLGPDDRHTSWTQIRLRESVDPSNLPDDLTIRKVEDYP